jgi:hypothetical protein
MLGILDTHLIKEGQTPPPPKKKNTNHLDWQGESSGLAGQSNILNDRM